MNVRKAGVALFLLGLALGLGLGVLVGWGIWPVEYYDTDPVDLKAEHKEDYVVLVCAAYALNGDLDQAKARLAKLEEEDVAQVVADLAQEYLQRGEDQVVTRNLVMLADALGSSTEAMIAYVATPAPNLVPTFTHTPTETPPATPTETAIPVPTDTPTATSTPLPPTPTPLPPTPTSTPQPPTPTFTPVPPTNTPAPPTPSTPPTETPSPTGSCPDRPEPTIRDVTDQVRDWEWMEETFGGVAIQQTSSCPDGAVYAVDTLWESHAVSLGVTVLDRGGNRVPNVPVAFFGFDGASCPEAGDVTDIPDACRPNACVMHTNQDGEATVSMGWGSGYAPPSAGYHAVWVLGSSSDCVTGLGMVEYTAHWHLNVTFRQISR